mgnify:CR=1 FL=1
MLYHAKNATLWAGDISMDYVRFGNVLEFGHNYLPEFTGSEKGQGDGLKTVKGAALPLAAMYRGLARSPYTVYAVSRRASLPPGFTTADMAEDLYLAMGLLGIQRAAVVGISQGGMIAQYLALRHPAAVKKLVLAVTICRQNPLIQQVIGHWASLATQGDYRAILLDTADKSFTPPYLKKVRWAYRLFGRMLRPKDPRRYPTMAQACLSHDAYAQLPAIACPTLVIGGKQDAILGYEGALDLHERIPGSQLLLYSDYGHGLYEEAKDFLDHVLAFLG